MQIRARMAVVVIALTLAGLFWSAPAAQAHTGSRHTSRGCLVWLHDNVIGALDWQDSETCATRDNYWRGHVRDSHATSDGHCVDAWLDGVRMARSCNSSGVRFTFLDPQRNFDASTFVCRSGGLCTGGPNRNF